MNASQYTWNEREPSVTASQLGKTNIGGAASWARISRTINFMAGVKSNLTSFPKREVIGQIRSDKSRRDLRPHTDQQGTHLLEVLRHRHFGQGGNFVRVPMYTSGRNGVDKKISIRGAEASLRGRDLDVMLAQTLEERTHVSTWAVGSESKTITSSR